MAAKNYQIIYGGRSDMCKLCEMIVKEALLDYSSKGIITLSLDGKNGKGSSKH